MEQENVRTLYANEIECRVGTISDKGLSLLLYKDARVDMKMLDEIYGVNNWQRKKIMVRINFLMKRLRDYGNSYDKTHERILSAGV